MKIVFVVFALGVVFQLLFCADSHQAEQELYKGNDSDNIDSKTLINLPLVNFIVYNHLINWHLCRSFVIF